MSDSGSGERLPQRFTIDIPDEVVAGVYADFASLWHTNDIFVLDFAALKGAPVVTEEEGQALVDFPTRIVARVRIPPGQVFELMKALEGQLSAWETETGKRSTGNDPRTPPVE